MTKDGKAEWEEASYDFALPCLIKAGYSSSQAPTMHAGSVHEPPACSHGGSWAPEAKPGLHQSESVHLRVEQMTEWPL